MEKKKRKEIAKVLYSIMFENKLTEIQKEAMSIATTSILEWEQKKV